MAHLIAAELRMLAVLAFGYSFALIAHEAGHAAMILAVGFELRLVRIGTGPRLLRMRVGRAWVVLRALPVYAYVMMVSPPPGRRGSQVAVTAAGALANLVCCVLLAAAAWAWPGRGDVMLLLALTQIAVILGVLAPMHGRYGGARLPSDGLRIWYLFTRPGYSTLPALHALLMKDVLVAGEAAPPLSRFSGEIAFQASRPDRLGDPWAARNAAQSLRGILLERALPSLERAFVLTFLSLSGLLFRNVDATVAELEAWSGEAAELTRAPLPRIVQAGVLVERGDFDAAEAALQAVLPITADAVQLVLLHAFMARALAGQGQRAAASAALARARAAVPKPQVRAMQPILATIEAGIGALGDPAGVPGWRQRRQRLLPAGRRD